MVTLVKDTPFNQTCIPMSLMTDFNLIIHLTFALCDDCEEYRLLLARWVRKDASWEDWFAMSQGWEGYTQAWWRLC